MIENNSYTLSNALLCGIGRHHLSRSAELNPCSLSGTAHGILGIVEMLPVVGQAVSLMDLAVVNMTGMGETAPNLSPSRLSPHRGESDEEVIDSDEDPLTTRTDSEEGTVFDSTPKVVIPDPVDSPEGSASETVAPSTAAEKLEASTLLQSTAEKTEKLVMEAVPKPTPSPDLQLSDKSNPGSSLDMDSWVIVEECDEQSNLAVPEIVTYTLGDRWNDTDTSFTSPVPEHGEKIGVGQFGTVYALGPDQVLKRS